MRRLRVRRRSRQRTRHIISSFRSRPEPRFRRAFGALAAVGLERLSLPLVGGFFVADIDRNLRVVAKQCLFKIEARVPPTPVMTSLQLSTDQSSPTSPPRVRLANCSSSTCAEAPYRYMELGCAPSGIRSARTRARLRCGMGPPTDRLRLNTAPGCLGR